MRSPLVTSQPWVIAVDASPAQHAMATHLYGHLAPHLRIVHCDVANHLHATAATYDMLYSVFGGVDFINPGKLQPAAATALRPGGRLEFSTLAHEEASGVFNLSNLIKNAPTAGDGE